MNEEAKTEAELEDKRNPAPNGRLCAIDLMEDGTVEAFLKTDITPENAAACMAALIAKIGTLDMDGDRFQKAMMQMAGGM